MHGHHPPPGPGRGELFRLPVTPEEALKSCVLLEHLADHAEWSEFCVHRHFPLAVAIHRSEHGVIVRLHTDDDPDAAQAEAEAVLDGSWRARL
ncbi:MAG: hypothetical protein ABIK89_13180 [Planctomycetota bacterium]